MERYSIICLLAYLALLGGCLRDFDRDGTTRIGCAGDSNSAAAFSTWVADAATLLTESPVVVGVQHTLLHLLGDGIPDEPVAWVDAAVFGTVCGSGAGQVANLLTVHNVDVVIAAFGTNDLRLTGRRHRTPMEVLQCYLALQAQVAPRQFLPATTPPNYAPNSDSVNVEIDELNTLIRTVFTDFVEFHDGFTRDLFEVDGVHLNAAGHQLRAERAVEAVTHLKQAAPQAEEQLTPPTPVLF